MTTCAILALLAQTAMPPVAAAPAQLQVSAAEAGVRVLEAARIEIGKGEVRLRRRTDRNEGFERRRDAAGTAWIEFA